MDAFIIGLLVSMISLFVTRRRANQTTVPAESETAEPVSGTERCIR